ncbi:lipid A biosynthesis acyltransferase [Thioalkalivibrio denitrificans]|uniref:Lipid A biosynthesis acyltransferase n=1 Tax=Thioalkalivibrio denitrificans TaxID=108003 RepID=A0A1V3NUM4_9GAMM|nr:lipid A biosynthesis acyltransferase [Thioalkalivibrio denitrificans]OOG28653.1 lipid A biosynthesis acyltransferase [Thioalkalivibrio denitrificans]
MGEFLLRAMLGLLARLPLALNHAVGASLGWIAWVLPTRLRRVSLANLARCFPERDAAWQRRVARTSLMETGKALTEAPWLWRAGPQRIRGLLRGMEGQAHLDNAIAEERGAFLVSPHLGSWEFAGLHLATLGPMTSLYRPPRIRTLDGLLRASREATGARLVPTTPGGIKALRRALERGEFIGMLPDQTPKGASGVFAPFFGHPAYTMVLLPRLAAPGRTPVLFGFAERLPRGGGYRYHVIPASEELYDPDPQVAAAAVNRAVETLVRQCPEQYAWSYRRFSRKTKGNEANEM